jgi:flagellar hook-basal body complex protein FliE
MRIESFRPLTYNVQDLVKQTQAQRTGTTGNTNAAGNSQGSLLDTLQDTLTNQAPGLIDQINKAASTTSTAPATAPDRAASALLPEGGGGAAIDGVGGAVNNALHSVSALQGKADVLSEQVVTGDPESAHKAVIAMEHALMALDFTLQIRNKVLDAYQEIMKTQV